MLKRWQENLIREFKLFFLWCLLLSVYRLFFILTFKDSSIGLWDISLSMFYGLRISLKTVGIICLVSGVFATLPHTLIACWPADSIRKAWHGLCFCYSLFLIMVRIPYYGVFNATFDMMIINGLHDDANAILQTMVQQYQLLPRLGYWLGGSIVVLIVGKFFYNYFIRNTTIPQYSFLRNLGQSVGAIVFLVIWFIFCRWGGAFTYESGVNWENCAKLKSNLLNEAILDDGQALYRVYCMFDLSKKVASPQFTGEEMEAKIKLLGKDPSSRSITTAFEQTAPGPSFAQPQQIIVVIGESFGLWPFEERFAALDLVSQTKALANSDDGCQVESLLPHGGGTIASLNGFLSGLPNTGIYENYNANMLKTAQPTAIAKVMNALGYTTHFWYGGFSRWQNIKNITLAQGFQNFHCADEFKYTGGTAWGCPDKVLFNCVETYVKEHPQEKMFHLILTSSNHPPYTIDLDKEGFPRDKIKEAIQHIADIPKNDETINELGHIWYTDATIGNFVKTTEEILPDSLFVITGDHSERFTFAVPQGPATRSTVPCIFYGRIVDKNFVQSKFGEHLDILPTIVNTIAPAGFRYPTFGTDLKTSRTFSANHALVVTDSSVRQNKNVPKDIQEKILARRDIGAWRITKGDKF